MAEKYTDWWGMNEEELIKYMGQMDPGTQTHSYLSNILQYKLIQKNGEIAEKNTKSSEKLVHATWGLVIATGLLVLITFFK